jgi:hypothetical protein
MDFEVMEETNIQSTETSEIADEHKILPRRGWRDPAEYDRVMYRTLALIEQAELAYREKMMNANPDRLM